MMPTMLRPRLGNALPIALAALLVLQGTIALRSAAAEPAADRAAVAKGSGGSPAGADPSDAGEATRTDSPANTIETFHAGLIDIMKHAKELGIQGRIDKLTPLMKETFDLDFMASKAVGRHWRKLSDEDKKRWIEAFTRFTTANYAGRFTGYTGEKFVTKSIEEAPRNTRMVMTEILVPNDKNVQLNYRLIDRDGKWKVIDVFLDGTVSELALRRSEYSSALKRDGFEHLLASVETKIKDLKRKGEADG
ncbi:MAG TPA: toluene tolerance protein [Deltaproteobacteria bacterium]|nr:toluene tolerance protein [Deltaproteobacteria bacterium]